MNLGVRREYESTHSRATIGAMRHTAATTRLVVTTGGRGVGGDCGIGGPSFEQVWWPGNLA
jgi:hypothetical protein